MVVNPLHPFDLVLPVLLVELVNPLREFVVFPGHPEWENLEPTDS